MKFGIYRFEGITDEATLETLDKEFGVPVSIRSFFRAWNKCRIEDDLDWLRQLAVSSRDVLLTWEPWRIPGPGKRQENNPAFSLKQISSGCYDTYIREMARALAALPVNISLRPMHEMNGNWYPWCGKVNSNRPGDFLSTWYHLRRLFAEEGATEISWVWSPYVFSYPAEKDNDLAAYFPGDDELDLIGLDGYNWGNELAGSRWQSFAELFAEAYNRVTVLSNKKIIIAETASASGGGDKVRWLDEMLDNLSADYARLEALVWFDINKECDWRLASSEDVIKLFRKRSMQVFV